MRRVTEIMRACGLREWPPGVPQKERDYYLSRGTAIHKATALWDAGILNTGSMDERIAPFLHAWTRFRRETGGDVVASELRVEYPALDYGGTLDRIIRFCSLYPTGCLLADIKTTQADVWTRLQTAGYRLAYRGEGQKRMKRGFVALRKDGTYRAGVYDEDARDKAAWMACCQLAAWMERHNKFEERTGGTP